MAQRAQSFLCGWFGISRITPYSGPVIRVARTLLYTIAKNFRQVLIRNKSVTDSDD